MGGAENFHSRGIFDRPTRATIGSIHLPARIVWQSRNYSDLMAALRKPSGKLAGISADTGDLRRIIEALYKQLNA